MAEQSELEQVLASIAGVSCGATFQACALVRALAERGLVDPLKVAAWADVFAAGQSQNTASPPNTRQAIADSLGSFAELLRKMATKPEGELPAEAIEFLAEIGIG